MLLGPFGLRLSTRSEFGVGAWASGLGGPANHETGPKGSLHTEVEVLMQGARSSATLPRELLSGQALFHFRR